MFLKTSFYRRGSNSQNQRHWFHDAQDVNHEVLEVDSVALEADNEVLEVDNEVLEVDNEVLEVGSEVIEVASVDNVDLEGSMNGKEQEEPRYEPV